MMNPALEQLLKSSAIEDHKASKPPQSLTEAIDQVTAYIETQLPKVIDIDFTPICFDINEEETRLILGGYHGNLAIFNLEKSSVVKDIELCTCPILSITFCLKDSIIIVITQEKVIYILDFPSFNLAHHFKEDCDGLLLLKPGFLRDTAYISNFTENVIVIDLKNFESDSDKRNEVVKRFLPAEGVVTCLDICDDGCMLAFGYSEGIVRLFHGETESKLQETEVFEAGVNIVAFSRLRRLVAAGFTDFRVIVWNIDEELSVKSIITLHSAAIKGLAFVKDNRYLITGGDDTKIVVHDMKVDRSPYQLELFDEKIHMFKPSIDTKRLFFTQDMNKLMIWDVPFLAKLARYSKHNGKVTKLMFIKNTFELISLGDDGLAIVWDYRNDVAQEVIEIESPLTTGAVSTVSNFAFLASEKPSLLRWSLASYKYYEFDLNSPVRCMRFSSDESLLALGDDLFRIIIYDSIIMERKYIIKGHTDIVTELYFIKNDSEVISASRDNSLVEWQIVTSDKVTNFHGHTAAVTCMIVTPDETWVISGSEDNTIIIWSLDNVLMHILPQEASTSNLYLSKNKSYLISLQHTMMNYWQLDNLSLLCQKTLDGSTALAVSDDEKTIAISEGNTIFVEENPLESKNIRVIGKNYGSSHKFMNYIVEMCRDGLKPQHLDIYNHWLFTPYCMGVAHVLAYSNRYDALYPVLCEDKNRPPFCSTVNNETPLSISVEMDHKSCAETCLKYMKTEFNQDNKRAYVPLGTCLTKLNMLDIPSITKIYDTLYQRSFSHHLPIFCFPGSPLPSLYYSDIYMIKTSNLIPDECTSTHGQSIAFYHTICPLELNIGSDPSIEFLESLLECPYPEIFRTKLLQVILLDKWEHLKWAIYIQGMLYIFYLVQLSFFCIFFRDSPMYLVVLFAVHILLFLYEVIQITTDFFGYWLDTWNLLDQARGLSFTVYCFLEWTGSSNKTVLLTVIIFSWTRGISYFRMFDGTRYMVRLLTVVISDMQIFFIILFYSTLAFTFIFYVRKGEAAFSEYLTVSYRLDLGDFDADYTEPFDWIIFFLATVINPLVMLNLLISIISDTYGQVQETSDMANYQELTGMIIEIERLMYWKKGQEQRFYLQNCDFLSGNEGEKDKVNEKIKFIRAQLMSIERVIQNFKDSVSFGKVQELYEKIKEMGKEREEMQAALIKNQETLIKTQELLQIVSQKLEDRNRQDNIE